MNFAESQQPALCKMDIGYESNASASFLVIRSNAHMPEYRYQMLINNSIDYLVPLNIVRGDETNSFFYNITSMISLSFFLKRHKLTRNDFLKLVLGMASAVENASAYMLPDYCFLFEPEYIFLNPESIEPSLVYLPCGLRSGEYSRSLQSFISDLLLQHINTEGFDTGNLVQQILSMTNNEVFSLKGFIKLINGLLYDQKEEAREIHCEASQICNREVDTINEQEAHAERCSPKKHGIFISLAFFAQVLLGTLIYLCRDLLKNAGSKPSVTYAAVAILVLAIDILIIKKLVDRGAIAFGNKSQKSVSEDAAISDSKDVSMDAAAVIHNPGLPDNLPAMGEKPAARNKPVMADKPTVRNIPAIGVQPAARNMPTMTDIPVERNKPAGYVPYVTDIPAAIDMNDLKDMPIAGDVTNLKEESKRTVYRQEFNKTELLCRKSGAEYILKFADGVGPSQDILLNKEDFIIGRLEGQVDYILKNNAVGKIHVQIITGKGKCYVKDLNSMNGTYINNARLESNKEYELKVNDSLRLANSEFILACR